MSHIKLVASEGEPNPKDNDVLVKGMLAYHAKCGYTRKSTSYSVLLKDPKDKMIGAVIVTFLWNGMEIKSLWVDESIRRKGWGRKLMQVAEEEAVKRGCTIAYTNTFTWQAPGFYEKLGYKLYGKLEDFPKGSTLSYFSKQL